jgi:hypothetical protein
MDSAQKYFAHLEIQNKILTSDGQVFEDLFTKIMGYKHPSFHGVKPQGRFGDMKNDGYIISSGNYYQVYGPEDLSDKIQESIVKIKADAAGLISHWSGINEITYVVNDKYKGANVSVHQSMLELVNEVKKLGSALNVTISLWTARHIEDTFFELTDDQMVRIIGPSFNSVKQYNDVDYATLSEVIQFISKIPFQHTNSGLNAPKYEDKIKFNHLSEPIVQRLNVFYLNNQELKNYFDRIGGYIADTLRDRFASLYEEAKKLSVDDKSNNDHMYIYIRQKACPENAEKAFVESVESLMAYYFETCDIFEEPKEGVHA